MAEESTDYWQRKIQTIDTGKYRLLTDKLKIHIIGMLEYTYYFYLQTAGLFFWARVRPLVQCHILEEIALEDKNLTWKLLVYDLPKNVPSFFG